VKTSEHFSSQAKKKRPTAPSLVAYGSLHGLDGWWLREGQENVVGKEGYPGR